MYLTNEQAFELLKTYGSPLYVYNTDTIVQRCAELKKFAKRLEDATRCAVTMHYSTKVNANTAILQLIKNCGMKAMCSSPNELKLNSNAGFSANELLYVCNNISEKEMEIIDDKGITVCLDSISQMQTWAKKSANPKIMVCINPGSVGFVTSSKCILPNNYTQFGTSEKNIPKLLRVADICNLKIIGVSQHLGNHFLDDGIDQYVERISAFLEIIKRNFKGLQIIDLGGGFGVPYKSTENPLSFDLLYKKLEPVLKNFSEEYPSVRKFKFEPGRFIVSEAGMILGTVLSVKQEYDTTWVGTDIGMNTFVRPSTYGSHHKIEIIEKYISSHSNKIVANICGNTGENGDILGRNRLINSPTVGDIVAVHNAGAYGYSMASNYTCRSLPAEVSTDNNGGNISIIRQAQSLDN